MGGRESGRAARLALHRSGVDVGVFVYCLHALWSVGHGVCRLLFVLFIGRAGHAPSISSPIKVKLLKPLMSSLISEHNVHQWGLDALLVDFFSLRALRARLSAR